MSVIRRWHVVAKYLTGNSAILVNFSSECCGCVAAYRYVCKVKAHNEILNANRLFTQDQNAMITYSANSKKEYPVHQSLPLHMEQLLPPSTPPRAPKRKRLSLTHIAKFLI